MYQQHVYNNLYTTNTEYIPSPIQNYLKSNNNYEKR